MVRVVNGGSLYIERGMRWKDGQWRSGVKLKQKREEKEREGLLACDDEGRRFTGVGVLMKGVTGVRVCCHGRFTVTKLSPVNALSLSTYPSPYLSFFSLSSHNC